MNSAAPRLSITQWLIITVAAIGFLFDTYELLMTPLVGVPAIAELLKLPPNHPSVTEWMGRMLWITALCGGVFGLLGGWLIDRFGRKRIMAASIFVYALSPFAAAFSTTLPMFVFFRCTTFIGVCVEFVAAITWLAELFPDKQQKQRVLGWTQAFASLGGILVTSVAAWLNNHAGTLPALPVPEIFNQHGSWRYLLMTGLLPAIPIALMLPFVPESQAWRERRASGTLKRPSFGALFAPELRRTTLVAAALSACAYAAAFGALQITPRSVVPGLKELSAQQKELAPLRAEAGKLNKDLDQVRPSFERALAETPGLSDVVGKRAANRRDFRTAMKTANSNDVATLGAEFKQLGAKLDELTASKPEGKQAVVERERLLKAIGDNREKQLPFTSAIAARGERVQLFQEIGGLVGRILLAILVVMAIASRTLLRIFVVPGLLALPLTYFMLFHSSAEAFSAGISMCGLLIVAQFSYFGEYLPKAFPIHLRGTGGSFATNVGGRMIGTSAAFLSTNLIAPMFATTPTATHYAMAAGIVGTSVFVLALLLSFLLPEPKAGAEH
ncbi:MAG TPA: MFS transporter [Verrucomicrobiae bacterium]|jgi:MFS family permease